MDIDSAVAYAHRLQSQVHKQISIDGERLTRSASMGVATGVPGGDNASDLLRRADQATRSAKARRRRQSRSLQSGDAQRETIRNEIELSPQEH